MYGYIYRTTNLINGKVYIGKHRSSSFDPWYLGSGKVIGLATTKYGIDNFRVEMISPAEDAVQLSKLEVKFIADFRKLLGKQSVYNISNGGGGLDEHPQGCKCKFCSLHNPVNHRADCSCFYCKSRRGLMRGSGNPMFGKPSTVSKHKSNCSCYICKSRRGEYRGKNNPMFGRSGLLSPVFGKPISHKVGCNCPICRSRRFEVDSPTKAKRYNK